MEQLKGRFRVCPLIFQNVTHTILVKIGKEYHITRSGNISPILFEELTDIIVNNTMKDTKLMPLILQISRPIFVSSLQFYVRHRATLCN